MVGHVLGEMKSTEDQAIVRRYFGNGVHRAVAIGETDIKLVNEHLTRITQPEAIAEAKLIRDEMVEIRGSVKTIRIGKMVMCNSAASGEAAEGVRQVTMRPHSRASDRSTISAEY